MSHKKSFLSVEQLKELIDHCKSNGVFELNYMGTHIKLDPHFSTVNDFYSESKPEKEEDKPTDGVRNDPSKDHPDDLLFGSAGA
jgi:hypothetical protein